MRYPRVIRYGLAALVFGAVGTAVGVGLAAQGSPHRSHVPAGLSGDKAAQAQRQVDALGPGNHKPARGAGTAEPAGAAQPRVAGINDGMRQGPFPASQFRVGNFYQGPATGRWYLVYAGAVTAPDGGVGPGAVRVIAESATFALTPVGMFEAPARTGPLKVLRADGPRLTLGDATGRTVLFDLERLRYG